jgi:hypothetical protein
MVRNAVKQVDDSLRIQIESGHFLPEPAGANPIRAHKLSLSQLARQQDHELALLPLREGVVLRLFQCLFHGRGSRDGLNMVHFRQRPSAPPVFAMKRINSYIPSLSTRVARDLPW